MGNNTNDKYQPMKIGDKVQLASGSTNCIYEVIKVGVSDSTEVKIKSTVDGEEKQFKERQLKLYTAEDAPPTATDKTTETGTISTPPSSNTPAKTSVNSLTPQTDDATNAINPSLPVSSSTLELKDIERIVEKLTGKSDSLPNATGTSTKDLQTALNQLEAEVKKLQDEVKKLEGEVKKLEGEVKKLEGEVKKLEGEVNTEKETSKQSRSDLADEKLQNKIAEDKWKTEKGTLNGEIGSEKQRAGKAEAESKERQTKLEASEQRLKGALNDFWKGRQEFYGALHRGMEQFRGKNADRYEDAQESRQESIKSDTQLLKGLGCQVTLEEEAVNLKQLRYDGADHQPFGTETINHETDATVLLPGWSYPDGEIGAKPVLSGKEIKQ